MATLQTYVDLLPPILKDKYPSSFWIAGANEILENLSSERILKELTFTRGVVVDYLKWIIPPSNYKSGIKLFCVNDENSNISFIETDGKLLLTNDTVNKNSTPIYLTITANTSESVVITTTTDIVKDQYKDYLLRINTDFGDLLGTTIQIAGNEASVSGSATLYFLHSFSPDIVQNASEDFELIPPENYLLLRYKGYFIDLASMTDEIPIRNDYEKRVMRTGLMQIGYERLHGIGSDLANKWSAKFDTVVMKMRQECLSGGSQNRPLGRMWAGMVGDSSLTINEDEDDE